MYCSNITGLTVMYLENKLNKKEKRKFIRHIGECSTCRRIFDTIYANYSSDDPPCQIQYDLKKLIMNKINTLPKITTKIRRPLYKVGIICTALIILITATVFAKPVYKSLDELVQLIFIDRSLIGNYQKPLDSNTRNIIQKADGIYEKNKEDIKSIIKSLDPGEIKKITYEEQMKDFYAVIAKGIKANSIIYGVKGIPGYKNVSEIKRHGDNENDNKISLREIINQGLFVPVPEKLPEEYLCSNIDFENGMVKCITYSTNNNKNFRIILNSDKAIINLANSQNLSRVGRYQAVYVEEENTFGLLAKMYIYLGEDKKQKVIGLSSYLDEKFDKSKFLDAVNSIKFYNEEKNNLELEFNGYFLNLKCDIPDKILDEFYNLVTDGKSNIKIEIEDNVFLTRKADSFKKHTYYIDCFEPEYSKINKYSNFPLLMNVDLPGTTSLEYFAVAGVGYKNEKEVFFRMLNSKCDNSFNVRVNLIDENLQKYLDYDLVMYNYIKDFNNNNSLHFDKVDHPYIIKGKNDNSVYLYTIKEVNGINVRYDINIPRDIVENMTFQEIIDGMKFIS